LIRERVEWVDRYMEAVHDAPFSAQSKFRSTILEEFLFYLFRDLVEDIQRLLGGMDAEPIWLGGVKAYSNLYFAPENMRSFLQRPGIRVNKRIRQEQAHLGLFDSLLEDFDFPPPELVDEEVFCEVYRRNSACFSRHAVCSHQENNPRGAFPGGFTRPGSRHYPEPKIPPTPVMAMKEASWGRAGDRVTIHKVPLEEAQLPRQSKVGAPSGTFFSIFSRISSSFHTSSVGRGSMN